MVGALGFFINTGQGTHRRHFLALTVGAPRCPSLTPPKGATVGVFYR
jgi:hypothetical protein